ncbi:hypothetical protein [Phytohabitans aurantiacus]|nr:hypothetical protein [Phytohabitans aurantiacus]
MSSFYYLYGWTIQPDLFHFRSATFGDGIFLPLAAGLLLCLARSLGGGRSDWLAAGGAAFLGGAAGTIVTLRALADPTPALNWTMPAPGVLNAAGLYHAVFLSLCSALIAGLLGLVLIRMNRLGRRSNDAVQRYVASPQWVGALAALLSFAGCLAADNRGGTTAGELTATLVVGIAAIAVLAAMPLITRARPAVCLAATLTAVIPAVCVAILAASDLNITAHVVVLAVIAIAGAVVIAAQHGIVSERASNGSLWLLAAISAAPLLSFAAAPVARDRPNLASLAAFLVLAATLLLLVLVLSGLLERYVNGERPARLTLRDLGGASLAWVLTSFAVFAVWLIEEIQLSGNGASLILLVVSLAILNWASPLLRNTYHAFVRLEEQATTPGRAPKDHSRRSSIVGAYLFATGVAGFGCLLLLTVAIAKPNNFESGRPDRTLPDAVLIAGAAAVLVAILAMRWSPQAQRRRSAAALMLLAITIWLAALYSNLSLRWYQALLVIPLAALAGIWSFESVKGNGALLQRNDASLVQVLLALAVGASTFTTVLWPATSGLITDGDPATIYWSLAAVFWCYVVNFILVVAVVKSCFPGPTHDVEGTSYSATAGTQQDHGLVSALTLLLVWLPAFVIAHVPPSAPERWTSIIVILYGLLFLLSSVYLWVMRYNTRHAAYRRHRHHGGTFDDWHSDRRFPMLPFDRLRRSLRIVTRRRADNASDEEWIEILEDHTALQNLVAMTFVVIAIIPVVPLLNEIRLRTPD